MFNNGMGAYNYPTGGYYQGMMYQGQPQKLNMTQGLTQEQMKAMRKTGGFNLDISQEELWNAWCTHRYEDKFAVSVDEEGNMTCSICGTKFKPFDGDVNAAREKVNEVIDLMETTKMQSLTLPQKTIQDVFQIEPLLKRLPELFAQTKNEYNRVFGGGDGYVYGQENNAFAMYQTMLNPMAGNGYYDPAMMNMNQGYAPQPMYGQPQMYNQQPQGQMYPGGQQPMYNNNGQPAYGYQQPYNNGPMNPQQPPQQPQGNPFNSNPSPVGTTNPTPTGNTGAEQVTVTKTMTD